MTKFVRLLQESIALFVNIHFLPQMEMVTSWKMSVKLNTTFDTQHNLGKFHKYIVKDRIQPFKSLNNSLYLPRWSIEHICAVFFYTWLESAFKEAILLQASNSNPLLCIYSFELSTCRACFKCLNSLSIDFHRIIQKIFQEMFLASSSGIYNSLFNSMQTRLDKDEHVHDPQEVSPLHFKDMRSFFSNGFPKIIEWVDLLSPSKKYQKKLQSMW